MKKYILSVLAIAFAISLATAEGTTKSENNECLPSTENSASGDNASFECVGWQFLYWQSSLNGTKNNASYNEMLYFCNGTMVWSGQEHGKTEIDTYYVSGKRIVKGNGGWFEIVSMTNDYLVLYANDGIYRTFKRK